MDLWQLVWVDHANIRELCREVLHATGSGPNSRAHLFAELDTELQRHFGAKENVLYPALARDQRTRSYIPELKQEHEQIRRRLDQLADHPNKISRTWALNFNELASTIRLHFSLEENGVLATARGTMSPFDEERLRRAFEREKIAYLKARRWHLPPAVVPERYGVSTSTAVGVVAGIATIWGVALAWRMAHRGQRRAAPLRPMQRRPEPPFPLQNRVAELGGHDAAADTEQRRGHEGTDASPREPSRRGPGGPSSENWFSSSNPPRAPSGIGSGLQPGGMVPGGGPAASPGAIGTGGGQTDNREGGPLRRDGR